MTKSKTEKMPVCTIKSETRKTKIRLIWIVSRPKIYLKLGYFNCVKTNQIVVTVEVVLTVLWPYLDLALNSHWPCFGVALTLLWRCLDLALIFSWYCLDPVLTLPWSLFHIAWRYLDLALTFPWPFLDLALTVPWPCLTFPWACLNLDLILPWPSLDLALNLPWPCPELALTLPLPFHYLALPWPFLEVDLDNLPLKFGQNWVSISWDIPDMDKYRQDRCCLKNCCHDRWNQFKVVPGIYTLYFLLE